jgi:hypothetical protein
MILYYLGVSLVMEQRAVVRCSTVKKLFVRYIKAELEEVCGHEALSLLAVKKWRKQSVNGRSPWKTIMVGKTALKRSL